MTRFRAVLGVIGLSVFATASILAFLTVSIPALRDSPRTGLLVAVTVFLAVVAALALAFRRRN